jgi:regulator of replication initiation timing
VADVADLDAELLGDLAARRLLEQAGRYVREALALPDDVANLRTITAEVVLENAMLRLDVQRLTERMERLERRAGGDRP